METMQISLDELLRIFRGQPETLEQIMARNYGADGLVGVHIETIDREHLMIVDPCPNEDQEVRAVTHAPDGDMQIRHVDLARVKEFTPSNGMHATCQEQQLKAARKTLGESPIEEARKGEPQF